MALATPIKVKSVVVDIADNHGNASFLALRQMDFYLRGKKQINLATFNYTTFETTQNASNFGSENVFDYTSDLTGSPSNNGWISGTNSITNQRLIIVFDADDVEIDEMRVNNAHDAGAETSRGANNVKIYLSKDALTVADAVYAQAINRSRLVFDDVFTEHVASNVEDEQILDISSGYKYLSEVACADGVEWFQRMRDFVCKRSGTYDYSATGIGWTLYDSSYAVDEDNITAGDWFVVRSQGSWGDTDFFVYFEYQTTAIKMKCSTFWNLVTQTTGLDPGSSFYNAISISTTDVPVLGVYGDMNLFNLFLRKTATATTSYLFLYGRLDSPISSDDVLAATSTYVIGSDISITFDEELPSDWIVGNKIILWSGESDGFERVELKTVDTGTKTITVDLTKNLPTSPVRGTRFFNLVYSTNSSTAMAPLVLIGPDGLENRTFIDRSLFLETSINAGISPDPLLDEYLCSDVFLWNSPGFGGQVPYMVSVAAYSNIPALSDTITIGEHTYKAVSNMRGSGRYAILEN